MKIEKFEFDGFDWDDGNYTHCQVHGIKIQQIEAFFTQTLIFFEDRRRGGLEKRWIAVGPTKKDRLMFVAYTFRFKGSAILLRPISARYIHRNSKEEKIYEEIKKAFSKEEKE